MMYLHERGPIGAQPVIFLHGLGLTASMWNAHMTNLKQFYCLAPDFPGFGRSRHQEWISIDQIEEELVELIRKFAQEGKVHVIGTSLGGAIAVRLMGSVPGLLESVVVDGAGVLPLPGSFLIRDGLRFLQPFVHTDFVIKTLSRRLYRVPEEQFEQFREGMLTIMPASFIRSIMQALEVRQPLGLEHAPCRVLFVAGERDLKSTLRSNATLAELMPNAHNRVVPGAGYGWVVQDPDLHIRMVQAWLGEGSLPPELIRAGF